MSAFYALNPLQRETRAVRDGAASKRLYAVVYRRMAVKFCLVLEIQPDLEYTIRNHKKTRDAT